ncbi:MAG: hypothetical protein HPY55_15840 [Firmicutes bacterium]|nr:hypothetical protein [Bacillota bacterium]
MVWSYSGNPASSPKDQVRFLVGDTLADDPLLSDEEIEFALASEVNTYLAAAFCCEAIAAKFARQADVSIGDYREAANQKAEAYRRKAEDLRIRALRAVAPYAGALTVADKQALATDPGAVQPAFRVGMHSMEA